MIELKKIEMGNRVPRVIHQTYPCKVGLPIEIQENIRKICNLNPNWEHRLYDDANIESYILMNYGLEVLQVYQKINSSYGAARADFFRYLLMYAEGGIYLDIKSSVTQPLDDVIDLDERYVLSKWDNHQRGTHPGWGLHRELELFEGGEYQQWHIIAVAGHPFLRAVIERVIKNIQHYNVLNHGVGRKSVLRVTGPIAYTLAIEDVKSLHPFREVNITQETGIEYSIYKTVEQEEDHKHIFTEHYANVKTPLISNRTFNHYCSIILSYMRKYIKKWHERFSLRGHNRTLQRKFVPRAAELCRDVYLKLRNIEQQREKNHGRHNARFKTNKKQV